MTIGRRVRVVASERAEVEIGSRMDAPPEAMERDIVVRIRSREGRWRMVDCMSCLV